MQIQIQARKCSLSDAHKARIEEKVAKLGRFIERVSAIDVVVEPEKNDAMRVEVIVSTELKKIFRADYSSDDLFGCLDQAIDKVEQQMRKFKEKLTDHSVPKDKSSAVETIDAQ